MECSTLETAMSFCTLISRMAGNGISSTSGWWGLYLKPSWMFSIAVLLVCQQKWAVCTSGVTILKLYFQFIMIMTICFVLWFFFYFRFQIWFDFGSSFCILFLGCPLWVIKLWNQNPELFKMSIIDWQQAKTFAVHAVVCVAW